MRLQGAGVLCTNETLGIYRIRTMEMGNDRMRFTDKLDGDETYHLAGHFGCFSEGG